MFSLRQAIDNFCNKKILVIGDVILDHYIWGNVERISPEAPVPVVSVIKETFRLGGAANVAANICSLRGKAVIASIIGDGEYGDRLSKMLIDVGVDISGIILDNKRSTTIKTRIIAHNQHVVRVDKEVDSDIDDSQKYNLITCIKEIAQDSDAILISDYDKGIISKPLLDEVIRYGKIHETPVIIDPKMRNFWNCVGATAMTPNLKEASMAVNKSINNENDLIEVGKAIFNRLGLSSLLITKGENGMSLFLPDDSSMNHIEVIHIPAVAKDVFDVTGAGDTVIAVYTLALASGADFVNSARISNYAAGIVVGEIGTACVKTQELLAVIEQYEKNI